MCVNVSSSPPLAVFTATIVGFVLALSYVSIYLQTHRAEILNPDVKDWNSFYSTLSDMDLCLNASESSKSPRTRQEVSMIPATTSIPLNVSQEANITYSVFAEVQISQEGKPLQGKTLHSFIKAKHLGFKGDKSLLEVTIELAKNVAKNGTACVTFSGPSHLLPNASQKPPKCEKSKNVEIIEVVIGQSWMVPDWCSEGSVASLTVAPRYALNVYLSEGDVTMIQFHILYTTCLLCVMMVCLIFYFVFGKRWLNKAKSAQMPDKVPLQS